MKALVTGATGLVGSHIVRALLAAGYAVRAGIRRSSHCTALQGLPIETILVDVLDRQTLKDAANGCDAVFHAAANFSYWGQSPGQLEATAVEGTANVLHAAAKSKVSRVVVTSSSVVLGYSLEPVTRNEHWKTNAEKQPAYVTSKVRQDQVAVETARRLGLDLVLTCPTVVVGPFTSTLGPSNSIITAYLQNPLRPTFPGGCNIVAAADVGAGHVLALKAGIAGERYVIGAENLEWREVHAMISDLCGTIGPLFMADRTTCYLGAALEEIKAQITRRPPATTRAEATMVGRYYWYESKKLRDLGFRSISTRDALATALSWLVASAHVSRESRSRLRLSDKVWAARKALCIAESELRQRS